MDKIDENSNTTLVSINLVKLLELLGITLFKYNSCFY